MDQDAFDSFTIHQLSVFGLGKLGLPLAALFAQNGLRTVGIDVDIALVEKLRTGTIPLLERDLRRSWRRPRRKSTTPPTHARRPIPMHQS